MHSFIGVPVLVRGGSVGNLYLTNRRGGVAFTTTDLELVEAFSRHAGIAIESARLHERIGQLAIVEERERIGRGLHDGIIQGIYAVALSLEEAAESVESEPDDARARIDRAIESLNLSIRDIRNFIFGLRPELLEQAGLVGGLAALADEFRLNTMVDIELEAAGVHELELPESKTPELLGHRRGGGGRGGQRRGPAPAACGGGRSRGRAPGAGGAAWPARGVPGRGRGRHRRGGALGRAAILPSPCGRG